MPDSTTKGTVFPMNFTPTSTFDTAPFLRLLEDASPAEIAMHIDTAIERLTYYVLSDEEGTHKHLRETLYFIRLLRNSILEGASIITFD